MYTELPLSIVIPTHNRSAQLAKSLVALNQQSWPTSQFEVLVVADACYDNTVEMVTTYAEHASYQLRLVSHDAKSAAATRNLGAAHANGTTLIFLDDDIIPDIDFVKAHMDVQQANGVSIGYSKSVLPERPSWWQLGGRLWWEDAFRAMRQPNHRFTYRDFFSGNVSLPTKLFYDVGGFDPSIRGPHDDFELGVRLLKAGAKFRYVPTALGYHYDKMDLQVWGRRLRQEGIADVQIGQHHPELRNIMFADFEDRYGQWGRSKRLLRKVAYDYPEFGEWLTRRLLLLAVLCERLRLRGGRWHLSGAIREVNYWQGVITAIGGRRRMLAWLQEGPMPPSLADHAPVIDMMALPASDELQKIFQMAITTGLRVAAAGDEILAIPPEVGAEPLRDDQLQYIFRTLATQQFIPALAFHLISDPSVRSVLC